MSTTVTDDLVEAQLAALRQMHPDADVRSRGDGTSLVVVPAVELPAGWNQTETGIAFLIPVGFPMAQPDCFWADGSLRLAGDGMPHASNISPVPGEAEPRLWFSWHLATWNPVTDSLLTYVRVIRNRFARGN